MIIFILTLSHVLFIDYYQERKNCLQEIDFFRFWGVTAKLKSLSSWFQKSEFVGLKMPWYESKNIESPN